jgi:hypothetical protein
MKKVLLVLNLFILLVSVQVYSQATCGGPCGGFTSTSASVNVNSNLTFTTSYTSGVTWSVSPGLSIVSSSAGSITIKGISVGTRYLCLSYNANGTVCSVCKIINVVDCPATPVVGFMYDPFASPPVVKATANVYSGSYSYTWYVNGVVYAGPTNGLNQIALPPTCGQIFEVRVSITSSSGCTRSSTCKRIYFDCSTNTVVDDGACQGLGDVERSAAPPATETKPKSKFTIYPNPSSGNVNLIFGDDAKRTIEVVDQEGTVVLTEIVSGKEHTLDVKNLKKGKYFIRQRSGKTGESSVERIVLE